MWFLRALAPLHTVMGAAQPSGRGPGTRGGLEHSWTRGFTHVRRPEEA